MWGGYAVSVVARAGVRRSAPRACHQESIGGDETELQKAALLGQVGHGVEDQSVGGGEDAELVDPAFAAAEDHEHGQVELGVVASSADRFDDQNAADGVDGFNATAQDLVRVLVVPVVQDVAQQVGIRPWGKRVEEADRGRVCSVVDMVCGEGAVGFGRGGF